MSNTNASPGLASTTVTVVDQLFLPLRLVPLNFTPVSARVAPFSHLPPVFSGLHSPMRGRSLTSA